MVIYAIQLGADIGRYAVSENKRYCKRCHNTNHIEKHHITPKSEGGSNKKENLRDLCKDCHDYEHTKRDIQKKIEYYKKMLILLEHRLEINESLNAVDLIKEYGYRSYWIDETTHGARKRSSYKRRNKRHNK